MPKKSINDIRVPTYDDLFTNEEQRQEAKLEKIMEVPVEDIQEFKNHPFRVRNDEQMSELVKSVSENGILVPVLVRPSKKGNGYEMVSGHRRKFAMEKSGATEIDAIVRDLDDDQATIIMVDSNIQRENILPTERGFAYKMKLDAMKRQGKRVDLTCSQVGNKSGKKSMEVIADEAGESKNQIHRYIRLTYLVKPLRDMVDGISEDGFKIALNPAYELSFLKVDEQNELVQCIQDTLATPSLAQAQELKRLSQKNELDEDKMVDMLMDVKPNQKEKLSLKMEEINKYFPKSYTPMQKKDIIIKLLGDWAKRKDKSMER